MRRAGQNCCRHSWPARGGLFQHQPQGLEAHHPDGGCGSEGFGGAWCGRNYSMDKTTKGFVIGACSVVIAVPVVWIGSQVSESYLIQQQIDTVKAEKSRKAKRIHPCTDRANSEAVDLFDETEGWRAKEAMAAWIALCMRSTAPVDEV